MSFLLSVIVPCYNVSDTILETIESIKKQTLGFSNIQLVAVDDNSSDETYEILSRLESEAPNVTVLKTPEQSGSPGPPRDLALRYVKAPYVMYVDADDRLEENAAEVLYSTISGSSYDVVLGNYYICPENGNKKTLGVADTKRREFSFDSLNTEHPAIGHFWTGIYNTRIITENGIQFMNGYSGQDIYFQLQYYLCMEKGLYIGDPIVDYCEQSSSRSHKRDFIYNLKTAESFARIYDLYRKNGRKVIPGYPNIDYILHSFLTNTMFSDDERMEIVKAWWNNLRFLGETGYRTWSSGLNILIADAAKDRLSAALEDADAIAIFERERQKELNDIFGSRTWKLASLMQKIFR